MRRWLIWLTVLVAASFSTSHLALDPSGAIRFVPFVLAMAAVGGIVATLRPENRLGWIFIWTALAAGYGRFAFEYAQRGGDPWVAWVGQVAVDVGLILFAYILLLFPTGKLPSPGWRWLGWGLALIAGTMVVVSAFRPGLLADVRVENPLGVEGAGLPGWAEGLSQAVMLLLVVASAASLIVRFRASRGSERLQLRWVAWATGVLAASFGGALFWDPTATLWAGLLVTLGFTAIPVAAGIAILRYRLYDIDLVINRTLVYGVLTAALAGVYMAGVVGLPRLLPLAKDNDLVVAGSTLAVAALFTPLRRRVQGFVDKRFYRQRYDAQQTVEAFSHRIQNQVDDDLTIELRRLVAHTLQPSSVSVWVREHKALLP